MKITDKQKELLVKMRDKKLKFSYMKLSSHFYQPDGRMFFVHENKLGIKNTITRLYNKGLLKMDNGEAENIYYINDNFKTFISSL